MIHILKTLPEFYLKVCSGEKTFEVRYNDRNYQVGDELFLREWDGFGYTGESSSWLVTYILTHEAHAGVAPGHVVMGIKRL